MVVGLAVWVWVCLWGVVVFFALATVRRNGDWKDEKSLFRAAEAVCPRSAKVHVKLGIRRRRELTYAATCY
jgi:hypothetical protein